MEQLFDNDLPVLPYNGTSGWSGSQTSRDRATLQDGDGTTSERQRLALRYLRSAGYSGLTWKEAAELTGLHHGAISGVLSVLHKQGLIKRLKFARSRCQVYVLPQHVDGREEAPYRPNASAAKMLDLIQTLEEDFAWGRYEEAKQRVYDFLSDWQGR